MYSTKTSGSILKLTRRIVARANLSSPCNGAEPCVTRYMGMRGAHGHANGTNACSSSESCALLEENEYTLVRTLGDTGHCAGVSSPSGAIPEVRLTGDHVAGHAPSN